MAECIESDRVEDNPFDISDIIGDEAFDGFDSLIPPEDGGIYINNKGAALMSVNTLMKIWGHPEMKDRVFEKLEEFLIGEYGSEEQEHD